MNLSLGHQVKVRKEVQVTTTIKRVKTSGERKERRDAQKQRSAKRALRKKGNDLERSKVAEEVHKILKVVTFEDLEADQLIAYKGIYEWWSTSQECGGVPQPLVVGGYSGTGKSTLLAIALPDLKNTDGSNVNVSYCAYTGKAANVLKSKGLPSSTIHSLIYHAIPDPITEEVIFELKDRYDLECELIVVDEASTVPEDMRKDLKSLGIPILYTGDHGQLPPVTGRGNIMGNPHFNLEEVHRQALDSGIIEIATMVRQKKMVKNGKYGVRGDATKVGSGFLKDIPFLSSADIVICHSNKTRNSLNKLIREELGFGGVCPQVGEKLICVKNNNHVGVFNGLGVVITKIEEHGGHYQIDCIDDGDVLHTNLFVMKNYFLGDDHPPIRGNTFNTLFEFAYAITGHKSQGSQWDHVIVIEQPMYNQTITFKSQWLYTTLTRAVHRVTWVSRFA
jgi:exodeoxyribonuclease-5